MLSSIQKICYYNLVFICYSVSTTHVIEKYVFILLFKIYVTNPLCSYVTLSLKPVFFCLIQKPHPVRLG